MKTKKCRPISYKRNHIALHKSCSLYLLWINIYTNRQSGYEVTLGQVLPGIYMDELETCSIPTLKYHLLCWKRYVDDAICFLQTGSTSHIVCMFLSCHVRVSE